jgi:hypothetical protein
MLHPVTVPSDCCVHVACQGNRGGIRCPTSFVLCHSAYVSCQSHQRKLFMYLRAINPLFSVNRLLVLEHWKWSTYLIPDFVSGTVQYFKCETVQYPMSEMYSICIHFNVADELGHFLKSCHHYLHLNPSINMPPKHWKHLEILGTGQRLGSCRGNNCVLSDHQWWSEQLLMNMLLQAPRNRQRNTEALWAYIWWSWLRCICCCLGQSRSIKAKLMMDDYDYYYFVWSFHVHVTDM